MARGFESTGGGKARFTFATSFKKDMANARKKAGRAIGREIVKERLTALVEINKARIGGGKRTSGNSFFKSKSGSGAISRRRRQAVRSLVGRDGTLVVMDHAPMAVIQETGGVIKPTKGKYLAIQDKRRREQGGAKATFVTKKGLVFEVAKHTKRLRNKDGSFRKNSAPPPKPRLVAILLTEAVIPRLPEKAQLVKIAESKLVAYRDLIEKYIIEDAK